jgi:3-deoxy-7-phosphoheptulonate synthase/chorismate mutase
LQETIQALRIQIDALNLQLLELLSKRAQLAEEIGELQTQMGTSHYDPVREGEMLEALVAANRGPFADSVVKGLLKPFFRRACSSRRPRTRSST